jgi:hypothetical protein
MNLPVRQAGSKLLVELIPPFQRDIGLKTPTALHRGSSFDFKKKYYLVTCLTAELIHLYCVFGLSLIFKTSFFDYLFSPLRRYERKDFEAYCKKNNISNC